MFAREAKHTTVQKAKPSYVCTVSFVILYAGFYTLFL